MNIQEAIKERTVIHCETEKEAKRILKMAHELGHNWGSGRSFTDARNNWRIHKCETCYCIINGACGPVKYHKNRGYKIINSTKITDMTTTDINQELTITPPEGYEIDEENSTFQKIVFRKIKPKFPTKLEEIDKCFPPDTRPKGWLSIEEYLPMMCAIDIMQGYTIYKVKDKDGNEFESAVSDHNVWYYMAKEAGITHWWNGE